MMLLLFAALHAQDQGTVTVLSREGYRAWIEPRLGKSVNLALRAAGGRLSSEPELGTDILVEFQDGSLTYTANLNSKQVALTLELAGGGAARVEAVAFQWGSTELACASVESRTEDAWILLARATKIGKKSSGICLLEFPAAPAKSLRIRIEGAAAFRLGEVLVFEAPGGSVASRGGMDIAAHALGGCIMQLHDSIGAPHALIDSRVGTWSRLGAKDKGAIPLVLAFAGNQPALVHSVAIRPPITDGKEKPDQLPARLRVSVSEEDPFEGFRPVLEKEIVPKEGEQRFELSHPETARFVRVEFFLGEKQTAAGIGELSVYEGTREGYSSVVVRAGRTDQVRATKEETLQTRLPGAEIRPEVEPNDESAKATPAQVGPWFGGTLAGPGDHDLWRFKLEVGQEDSAKLEVVMLPFFRATGRILDAAGNELRVLRWKKSAEGVASVPLSFPAGEYWLELRSAQVSVALGYDTSGSMAATFKTLKKALQGWGEKLPKGYRIALAYSVWDRAAKRSFSIASPFTSNGEILKNGAELAFKKATGSSDWYTVLADLLQYLDQEVPGDGVGALVYVADGNGAGDFPLMWKRLRESRGRVYTIGFGSVGEAIDPATGWDGGRGLYNVAWYRGGRYYEPKNLEELLTAYSSIFEDLQSPVQYAFRCQVRKREFGTLVTEPPPSDSRPVHFILDASGSMMAKCGDHMRFDVAREVVGKVLEALADDTPVGLRVYGHRHPTTDPEKAAKDSELLIPIGKVDRKRFASVLAKLRARGGTPLAFSLSEAVGDLQGIRRPRVLLITDGLESFRGDPVKSARTLADSSRGMDLAVVGFAMGEGEQDPLRKIAEAARGSYYDATDAETLVTSIQDALRPKLTYSILDEGGREVATGKFGDRHRLLEGAYACVVRTEGDPVRIPFVVTGAKETRLKPPVR